MSFKKLPRIFEPTDEDLINCHLRCKILNDPIGEPLIAEATIYGEKQNPWQKFCSPEDPYPWHRPLDDMGNEADYERLFVFSKVTNVGKKSGHNFQKNRVAGDGNWHGNNKKDVMYNRIIIGYSRLLTFRLPGGQQGADHWTMNEYTINPAAYPGLPASDWVVCKIKKHSGKISDVEGKVIKKEKSRPSKKQRQNKDVETDLDVGGVMMTEDDPLLFDPDELLEKLMSNTY